MYVPKQQIRVTSWKAADKNGDGDEVWRPRQDPTGQNIGRERARDVDGNPVRNYKVPDGFRNFPSFDHTPHYLRVNEETGEPYRTPTGDSVEIEPGTLLLEFPDGTSKLLRDEYEIFLFEQAHEEATDVSTKLPGEEMDGENREESASSEDDDNPKEEGK
jgi:hypothetical protein